MAIDTENKRRSVMAYASTGLMPVPDGTIDASNRACIGWLYSGIAFDAPSLVTGLAAQFHRLFHLHTNHYRFP